MKKHTIAVLLAVLLVVPIAPVLYALLGGGVVGGVACIVLGVSASAAMLRIVYGVAEFHNWRKHRHVYVEEPKPMPVPVHTAYEIDWTKITKGDNM